MSLIAIQNAAKTTLMKAQMDTRKTGDELGYAPHGCSALSVDVALAIADGDEPGDALEAARVLAGNLRWYKNEYERWRQAYAHDVRQNADLERTERSDGTLQDLVGNSNTKEHE